MANKKPNILYIMADQMAAPLLSLPHAPSLTFPLLVHSVGVWVPHYHVLLSALSQHLVVIGHKNLTFMVYTWSRSLNSYTHVQLQFCSQHLRCVVTTAAGGLLSRRFVLVDALILKLNIVGANEERSIEK